MRPHLLPLALLLLSACASAEERAQQQAEREIAACEARGTPPGSPEFEDCRLQAHAEAERRKAARMAFDPHDVTESRPQPINAW